MLHILLLSLTLTTFARTEAISPFETDYCTNSSEGTREWPELWKHCCLEHDLFFWAGGNKQDRYDSDLRLKSCIEETGQSERARIMYWAVRAGSYSPIKYPKRKWNNGWQRRRDYQTLSREDIATIENELYSGYDFINTELKERFINRLLNRLE